MGQREVLTVHTFSVLSRTATKLLIKDTLNFSVPLGSIPELPAISCREIEASEGKYNISNKHWLDSSYTGQVELVDCSDSVKGEF